MVEKTYIAKIKGKLEMKEFKILESGVRIENKKTAPAKVKIKKYDKATKTTIVKLTIHEGTYHQVKKMFETVGHEVIKLKREVFAGFTVDGLKPGEYRRLTVKEVKVLYAMYKG